VGIKTSLVWPIPRARQERIVPSMPRSKGSRAAFSGQIQLSYTRSHVGIDLRSSFNDFEKK